MPRFHSRNGGSSCLSGHDEELRIFVSEGDNSAKSINLLGDVVLELRAVGVRVGRRLKARTSAVATVGRVMLSIVLATLTRIHLFSWSARSCALAARSSASVGHSGGRVWVANLRICLVVKVSARWMKDALLSTVRFEIALDGMGGGTSECANRRYLHARQTQRSSRCGFA